MKIRVKVVVLFFVVAAALGACGREAEIDDPPESSNSPIGEVRPPN